jgi:DNA-binding MarR family transcriptional regulator
MSTLSKDIVLLLHGLQRSLQHHDSEGRKALSTLTLLQVQALFYIKSQEKVTMSELAEELQASAASATALVDRLIKMEWLIRLPHPTDRRVVYLALPDEKRRQFSSIMRRKIESMQSCIETLSLHDQEELHRILREVIAITNKPKEAV